MASGQNAAAEAGAFKQLTGVGHIPFSCTILCCSTVLQNIFISSIALFRFDGKTVVGPHQILHQLGNGIKLFSGRFKGIRDSIIRLIVQI